MTTSIAVIAFLGNPVLQLLPMILSFAVTFTILVKTRPFQETGMNKFHIVNEGMYLLILVTYVLVQFHGRTLKESVKYTYYGSVLIGLVSIVLAFNIGFCVWESYKSLVEYCKARKKGKVEVKTKEGLGGVE
jgi:hypothetical protein